MQVLLSLKAEMLLRGCLNEMLWRQTVK